MTESQELLKLYAETGSESAFRELVNRYANLVYATAFRLLNGDSQLAEDVSQSVFIGLARQAKGLSSDVALGGWLYRSAFHLATKAMRQERRRRTRERESIAMNTSSDSPEEIARRVRPMLDEALMQLGNDDRKLILLRFFEERDFRMMGASLNVSEDAARMRVARAVDKLQAVLKRRGVAVPVIGLGAALGIEGAKAAPAGVAAKLALGALAGASAAGTIPSLLVTLMNASKLKIGVSAIIAASLVTSIVLHQQASARLSEIDALARRQRDRLSALAAENARLSNTLAQANQSQSQWAELQRLRAEAERMRAQTNELALLRDEHQRLRADLLAKQQTPLQKWEARQSRTRFEMEYLEAFRRFEDKNDRSPTGFDEATPFLPTNSTATNCPYRENFEWVYQLPTTLGVTNFGDNIAIREIEPAADGNKVYGFADGHAQVVAMPSTWNGVRYNNFDDYERDHIALPTAK